MPLPPSSQSSTPTRGSYPPPDLPLRTPRSHSPRPDDSPAFVDDAEEGPAAPWDLEQPVDIGTWRPEDHQLAPATLCDTKNSHHAAPSATPGPLRTWPLTARPCLFDPTNDERFESQLRADDAHLLSCRAQRVLSAAYTPPAGRGEGVARPCVVISQPMYFPWVGLLQQVRWSDVFVFYDDVQFARGFFNRVQVKTAGGIRWMTVPLRDLRRGQAIGQVGLDAASDWRRTHRALLARALAGAPFARDALSLLDEVFAAEHSDLAALGRASTLALVRYFGLDAGRRFLVSSELGVPGRSTERLVDLCRACDAQTYLTGHGARHYLEHEAFERAGIGVSYMEYGMKPYPQQHGEFTPYVTALDLVAHCGREGLRFITGAPVDWRSFVGAQPEQGS
jgi:hypothetical protein